MSIKPGQLITLDFEDREFEVIVIDPNGLGSNQPSVGFGFNMIERISGLPNSTSSAWVAKGVRANEQKWLELPSGQTFRVSEVPGLDGNIYSVLEVADWVSVIADYAKTKGKRKPSEAVRNKLIDFLAWFAVKGFYAAAYASLKGNYTEADNRAVSAWMKVRLEGISRRNNYTKFLQQHGCEECYHYANWTNRVYMGLFGKTSQQMRDEWEVVEGVESIGRNHIPEVEGLEAVAYCENQVIELFHADLEQAHDDAINFAKKKFKLGFQ